MSEHTTEGIHITGDAAADAILADPFALLLASGPSLQPGHDGRSTWPQGR